MNILKSGIILAFFLSCTLFSACGSAANSNTANSGGPGTSELANDNANSAKTNAEDLGLLIKMPFVPEEAIWKEDPQNKKLIAVLRFSPEDAKKLVAETEKIKTPEKITLSTETWFPPELIAQGDMSSEDNLNGMAYSANSFFQPPYAEGRITRVQDTDYFVLEMSAK